MYPCFVTDSPVNCKQVPMFPTTSNTADINSDTSNDNITSRSHTIYAQQTYQTPILNGNPSCDDTLPIAQVLTAMSFSCRLLDW